LVKVIKHAINKNAWLFFAAAWVYTLSFIFTNYFSYSSSAEKVAHVLQEYIHSQENSFKAVILDSATVNAIISNTPSSIKKQLYIDEQGIFVYQVNDLGNPVEIFWNTNKMSPAQEDLLRPDGSYLVTYQNGIFELVKSSQTIKGLNYFFVSLIPVRWQYFMRNEYLKPHFAVSEAISDNYKISDPGEGAPVENLEHETLFSITEAGQAYNDMPVGFSVFLRIVAVLCLFVFVNKIATAVANEVNFKTGFILLAGGFLVLRLIIFFWPFPFNYRELTLFNTDIFYGGPVNKSLGDLLINALLAIWLILFFRRKNKTPFLQGLGKHPVLLKLLALGSFIIIPLTSFYISDIISGLVLHSTISFNAADFFSLSGFSVIGFIIICMLLYVWVYVTGLLVQLAASTGISFFWQNILIAASAFLLISLQLFLADAVSLLVIAGILLLLTAFMRYKNNPALGPLVNSSYFIIWAVVVTALTSALILYQYNIKEKNLRLTTARNIQVQTDSSGIYLVRIAVKNLSGDFLMNNFHRFQDPDDNKFIKDSLINKNLSAFLTKYLTKIYVFDDKNQPLYNQESSSFDIINSVIVNRSKPTGVPGMYFYREQPDSYNYIYEKKIIKDSQLLGTFFVLIQPRFYQNTTLVPELFRQTNDLTSFTKSGYAFGFYQNLKLTNTYSSFNFPDSVSKAQMPKTGYYFIDSLGYNQLWYNTGNNRLLIITKKNDWFSGFVTLFSYLFVLFILLAFCVHESKRLVNRNVTLNFRNLFRFNVRTQIQATIIGVSIVSFLIIGIATISFFIIRFEKNTNAELKRNSQIIVAEVEQALKYEIIPADLPGINQTEDESEFQKKITGIAAMHNTDINFYAKNGILLVSSQPYIYTRQVVSNRIDPDAFYDLHYNQSTRFVQPEFIGTYKFQSIYSPVKDEKGDTIAYLNIPSLSAQNELEEEISDFLVTLIILNALSFIFAGAIAVALTGRITASLELIGNKMKEVKIGSTNEVITWQRDDEIGLLVDEYNKMVKQLGQSAESLAKSEREGAWREMAKQVAHEIKNPLTPMKLSIQYLQRAMEENSPHAVELSKKLASTLIEQIDQLSKIASDFSQFANIENIKPEFFNINAVIQNLVNLYKADSGITINYTSDTNEVEVYCDKMQVNRLFTNLIKNAIEAYDETAMPNIDIRLFNQRRDVIIAVKDSGSGIDEELRSKIFNPNFTTKSSGTGLGLAICKAIVEHAGGKIWFTTSTEGTSFYVKLPLANAVNV